MSAVPTAPRTPAWSRRVLLLAGTVGASTLAGLATLAPAHGVEDGEHLRAARHEAARKPRAAAEAEQLWPESFLTRPETREGFDVDALHPWQEENARFVIAVVKGHELGREAAVITLITAIVESWLYNYEPAVDLDSGGLFQQRPSMGWGTAAEVRHKQRAIKAFLGVGEHSEAPGLLQVVPDHQHWEPGAAAQAVQASAHPWRYAQQVAAAEELWDRFATGTDPFTD